MMPFNAQQSRSVLPAHAVERLREDLRRHAVLMLQDQALLQCDRHRRSVLGALAAGETDAVQSAANLKPRERGKKRWSFNKQIPPFFCV